MISNFKDLMKRKLQVNMNKSCQTDHTDSESLKISKKCECKSIGISNTLYCVDCQICICYQCFLQCHQFHRIANTLKMLHNVGNIIYELIRDTELLYFQLLKYHPEHFLRALICWLKTGDSKFYPHIIVNEEEIYKMFSSRHKISYSKLIYKYQSRVILALQELEKSIRKDLDSEMCRIRSFGLLSFTDLSQNSIDSDSRNLNVMPFNNRQEMIDFVINNDNIELTSIIQYQQEGQQEITERPWNIIRGNKRSLCLIDAKSFIKSQESIGI